ncbi:MAG: mechanosensitive ion channel family protein [Gemmatimonadota bacterium]|nr:MAG: mechanosensitive ion channel family protein [Gemmatimonadota bacterium]
MNPDLSELLNNEYAQALAWLLAGLVAATLARVVIFRTLHVLTRRSKTDVDDQLATVLRWPVIWTFILLGLSGGIQVLEPSPRLAYWVFGVLKTILVIIWSVAAGRVGTILLRLLARQADRVPFIQPKTLPLFEMVKKITVAGAFVYFLLSAWQLNLTTWLASAGVVGIAVGFAARDTLANLFSGVFIMADSPYQIGDYIYLDDKLRGKVTDIGLRSTRILTRDDIEVTVPNAVVAGAKIVNESAGPHEKLRVRVKIGVAYGSDVDQVETVLLSCCEGIDELSDFPHPRVRLRGFGESSLDFELLAWTKEPELRGRTLHELNKRVYKALAREGIAIPFPQRDLHVKAMPTQVRAIES